MTDTAQVHCTRPWYMRPPVWLLGFIVVALIVFGIVETAGGPAPIPYSSFLDQLDAGNIASVTFQGTQIDGRFKHPVGNTAANASAQQIAFRSRVPAFGDASLLPELRKEHVAVDVVSSSSWTSLLAGLPWPMVIFLAAIVIAAIVRLVRGGKVQSSTGVPVHPMQGMIGLVSGLFSKQQAPNAPQHGGDETKSG
jgi:ATP-dependent Zn protease